MRRVRRSALAAVLAFLLACETMLPSTILLGGAVLQVVAVNQFIDQPEYLTAVSGLIATMTSLALAAGENYLDYRARQQELARVEALEAEIASEYDALKEGEEAPPPSWEPPAEGAAAWSGPTEATLPGLAAADAPDAQASDASPWGDRYAAGATGVTSKGIPAPGPIPIDVAVLKNAGGRAVPIGDGDTLFDGIDDPQPADQLRVAFRPRSDAFVYVVAIDAAGRVQPLYPKAYPTSGVPVAAGSEVFLPGADGWYGLDRYTGIQHVYFVAAPERRTELEGQLAWFASQGIPELAGPVHTVSEVTRVEEVGVQTRGLTGVETQVDEGLAGGPPGSMGSAPGLGSRDQVITRHFVHR